MPVYNSEMFIKQSIQSILDQTFTDFELIILNDFSTDNSLKIIESFNDNRIRVINHFKNIGFAQNLNYGINISSGKYIARMDNDDIALQDRLQKQFDFLETNHKYKICCGNALVIDEKGIIINKKMYKNDLSPIDWQLFWTNPVIHPTIFFRKNLLTNNNLKYNVEMNPAEDYDLWCNIIQYSSIYRMDDILIKYRRLTNSQYHSNIFKAAEISYLINKNYLESTLNIKFPDIVHQNVIIYNFTGVSNFTIKYLAKLKLWNDNLFKIANNKFKWNSKEMKMVRYNIYNLYITIIKRIPVPFFYKVYLYFKYIPINNLFFNFFSLIKNRL